MGKLTCTGEDGIIRAFDYTVTQNSQGTEWTYRVRSNPPPESDQCFELTVELISSSEVRIAAMYNNGELAYIAKGIPDSILPLIASELNKSVCSSPSNGGGNTFRTAAATKVWDRLAGKGLAKYSAGEDVYRIS